MDIIKYLGEFNAITIIFRLLLALMLGGFIGIEREQKTRSAGFRTHSLVCIGATLVMLTGVFINESFDSTTSDVARLGAQVVSGVGFLGAGAIMSADSQKVRGLTTAAALWTCAGIGLAIGVGFYTGAIGACIFAVILLRVLKVVDKKYRNLEHFVDLYIELYNARDIQAIIDFFGKRQIPILWLESVQPKVPQSELGVKIMIKVTDKQSSSHIIAEFNQIEAIRLAHKVYM